MLYFDFMTNKKAIAEKLLQINAVKLNPAQPYTWSSGWKSPIYCDNRTILSFPIIRDLVKSEMCSVIFEQFADADLLAGVATAGIAWGAMAADQLKLPYVYVRPNPKGHGMGNQIEGVCNAGQKAVVIEDLISTGKSSFQVCEVLKEAGLEIAGIVAIFDYEFDQAAQLFLKAGISYTTLTNYSTLIELALHKGLIQPDHEKALLLWRQDPANWIGL